MAIVASVRPLGMRGPSPGPLLDPRLSQFLVVAALLGVLLIPLYFFMLEPGLYEALAFYDLRPQIEKAFGFTAQRTSFGSRPAKYGPFQIVSLVPDGRFASSGVCVGDVVSASAFPDGAHAWALYGSLATANGAPVEIRFFRGPALNHRVFLTIPTQGPAPPNPGMQRTRYARR